MATLILSGSIAPGGILTSLDDENLTGYLIDYAQLMGVSQGFDPRDSSPYQWQISQAGILPASSPATVSVWVQFVLPKRVTPLPFAGITSTIAGALSELGFSSPTSFTWVLTPADYSYLEPSPDLALPPIDQSGDSRLSLSLYSPGPSQGPELQTDIFSSTFGALRWLPDTGSVLEAHQVPEYWSTCWEPIGAAEVTAPLALTTLIGLTFNTLIWQAQEASIDTPLMLRLEAPAPRGPGSRPRCSAPQSCRRSGHWARQRAPWQQRSPHRPSGTQNTPAQRQPQASQGS